MAVPSFTPHTTAVIAHPLVTDLTICVISSTGALSTGKLGPRWRLINKDLHQYTDKQTAWLYQELADEKDLLKEDLVVTDIRLGERPPDPSSDYKWEGRPGGIWVLRSKFSGNIDQVVTQVNVLFGVDAVDPRSQWTLMPSSLRLDVQPSVPVARLSVLHGRTKPHDRPTLRVRKDGKIKIVQIADAHMGVSPGKCPDRVDAHGNHLPESEADPLTVNFIEKVLDTERPDLVVLTGDQVHHDITDTESALFKVLAPIIERKIPFAAVFGNHDSEGTHALSREAQMSILQNMPFSLCEPGPEDVDGIGNYHLQVYSPDAAQLPLLTLYFLDSHGQTQGIIRNDYDYIKQSQIDWYVNASQALRKAREKDNNDNRFHLSFVFQHIPLPEYGYPNLRVHNGYRREPTEGPSYNSHFYDALVKENTKLIICGHDHVNNFCGLCEDQDGDKTSHIGPWLCYGGGCGFGGYGSYGGNRYLREMRVVIVHTKTGTVETHRRDEYDPNGIDSMVLVESGEVVDIPKTNVGGRHCVGG